MLSGWLWSYIVGMAIIAYSFLMAFWAQYFTDDRDPEQAEGESEQGWMTVAAQVLCWFGIFWIFCTAMVHYTWGWIS